MTPTLRAGLAVLVAAGCATPPVAEPEPEFDDLDPDTTLRGPKAVTRPRIIDGERLAAVLERLPITGDYDVEIDGIRGVGWWRMRGVSEPRGYLIEIGAEARQGARWARSDVRYWFGPEPPHRLERIEDHFATHDGSRTTEFANRPGAMWSRTVENGEAGEPERRPASRETLAPVAALFVDPELLTVGAMQSFTEFRISSRRDVTTTLEVVGKGPWRVDGQTLPTVVFETATARRIAVADGRILLGLRDRSGGVRFLRRRSTLDSPR